MLALHFPKKFLINGTNAVHTIDFRSVITLANCKSFISCVICIPLTILALIFLILMPENVLDIHRKHVPSLCNNLANYFIKAWLFVNWRDNDLFCGNQELMNDVSLDHNYLSPRRALFPSPCLIFACCPTSMQNKNAL